MVPRGIGTRGSFWTGRREGVRVYPVRDSPNTWVKGNKVPKCMSEEGVNISGKKKKNELKKK